MFNEITWPSRPQKILILKERPWLGAGEVVHQVMVFVAKLKPELSVKDS